MQNVIFKILIKIVSALKYYLQVNVLILFNK